MNKLAPRAAIETPAGTIWLPDWVQVYVAPEEHERRSLFDHMKAVGVPPTAWNEWRRDIGCERVSDIKSLYSLFTVWVFVAKWQKACRVGGKPSCSWGASIYEQVHGANYVAKSGLIPTAAAL